MRREHRGKCRESFLTIEAIEILKQLKVALKFRFDTVDSYVSKSFAVWLKVAV